MRSVPKHLACKICDKVMDCGTMTKNKKALAMHMQEEHFPELSVNRMKTKVRRYIPKPPQDIACKICTTVIGYGGSVAKTNKAFSQHMKDHHPQEVEKAALDRAEKNMKRHKLRNEKRTAAKKKKDDENLKKAEDKKMKRAAAAEAAAAAAAAAATAAESKAIAAEAKAKEELDFINNIWD